MTTMSDRSGPANGGTNGGTFEEPALAPGGREEASMPYAPEAQGPGESDAGFERARQKLQCRLASVAGVTGITRDQDPTGTDMLVVYVRDGDPALRAVVPSDVDGIRVEIRTGEFFALAPER